MGILQAGSLFTGQRALTNFNVWASISFIAYAASITILVRPWQFIPKISSKALALAAILLGIEGLILAYPIFHEFLEIDTCLDLGGSFNYVTSTCDHLASHSPIRLMWRKGFRALLSFSFIVSSIALVWAFIQRIYITKPFK